MQIRRITVERFRGLSALCWNPNPGINCLIGPGDTGKTTLLDAVALATSPAPAGPASEHDYHRRRTEDAFALEFVVGALSDAVLAAYPVAPCWGWRGSDHELLDAPVTDAEPVLRVLVRGTPDLEVEHRLLAPNGEELFFSAEKRRLFGLCRVGEMRGSSREFRMARGSLLERTLGREEVRGAAARAVRRASAELDLPEPVSERLEELGERLKTEQISSEQAALEVLSPPGQSLLGLLGLALGSPGEAIPLAYFGQGAQRLASFVLATELAEAPAIVVMDEVEAGLEPYRQRLLVQRLRALLGADGQAFLTTHAPAVLDELDVGELQRLAPEPAATLAAVTTASYAPAPKAAPVRLPEPLGPVKARDPEALLCRTPVVCEGLTEVELLRVLLDGMAASEGLALRALGLTLVDGGGQPQAFKVINALSSAGFLVGAFLDEEPEHGGRRAQLRAPGYVRGGFRHGRCTEDALAHTLPEELLDELLDVCEEPAGRLGDARRQQLSQRLGTPGGRGPSELAREHGWEHVREAIAETAHRASWWKTRGQARALAHWLIEGRLPAPLSSDLADFWTALRGALSPTTEALGAPRGP